MNGILLLISALEPLALQELQALTGLSPANTQLIEGITGTLQTFLSLFRAGSTSSTSSLLAALEASIGILQSQTNVDPKALAITSALIKAIQAGVAANNALTIVIPEALQPISPIV